MSGMRTRATLCDGSAVSCVETATYGLAEFRNRQEQANVEEPAPASFVAGKVWQLSDLDVLDELSTPVIVIWIQFQPAR